MGSNLGTQLSGQGLFPQASLAESDACSCSWAGPWPGSADLHKGQAELAGLRADSWHQERLGEEAPEIWETKN